MRLISETICLIIVETPFQTDPRCSLSSQVPDAAANQSLNRLASLPRELFERIEIGCAHRQVNIRAGTRR
jgi:hypothetical protein